ncbi:MAG: GNAT family N-acetyltransferase [Thalassobaculales bacterium]
MARAAGVRVVIRKAGRAEDVAAGRLARSLLDQYPDMADGSDPAARVAARPGELLLAFAAGMPVGFAAYALAWPGAGLAPTLYLKQLYVEPGQRGQGVGRRLMAALAREARAAGCARMEWTVLRDNADALAFYQRLGARAAEHVVDYRIDGPALAALAEE